jgi:predicted nucleic acid-binding protein
MALPFLDTNVLLRHFLDDHADHSPRATAYLQRIDAYFAALMEQLKLTEIVSFDRDFDRVPGLTRVEP